MTEVATSDDTANVVPPSCGRAPSGTGTNEPGQISLTEREPRARADGRRGPPRPWIPRAAILIAYARLRSVTLPDERNDKPLGLFRRLLRAGQVPTSPTDCEHLRQAPASIEPNTPGRCEDHTPEEGPWVHLRVCLTCGHVGCCDSSRPRHASVHFERTGHPVMQSAEPGESWRWCFVDELLG